MSSYDSSHCVLWPEIDVAIDDKKFNFEWYTFRKRGSVKAPLWHECLTSFVHIEKQFGAIASLWMKKRERFGPGFYIYMGVRRAEQIYTEHRFLNLISGIESLHRRKHISPTESETLTRIARIMGQVTDSDDRKWLKGKLKHAHESNLADRIYEVLSAVDLKFKTKLLRKFSVRCADLRNRLSHFGAQESGINYDDFISEISQKNEAISVVYHMVILHEIGVDDKIINEWIYEKSFTAKAYLVEAGLLDKSVLQPPTLSAPPKNTPAS